MRITKALSSIQVAVIVLCLQVAVIESALAETPYARTCRIAGGQPWVVNFSETQDLTLCRFSAAAIGAPEFAQFKWNQIQSDSIRTILSAEPTEGGASTCQHFSARFATAKDSDRRTWGLCLFQDGSAIEVKTLSRGAESSANALLIEALKQ